MITEIKLTPRRRTFLSDMGINDLNDLINYYPKKYEDLSETPLTSEYDDKKVVCIGRVYSEVKYQKLRNNLSRMQFLTEIGNEIYTITGTEKLYLNWAKAGIDLPWPSGWDGEEDKDIG